MRGTRRAVVMTLFTLLLSAGCRAPLPRLQESPAPGRADTPGEMSGPGELSSRTGGSPSPEGEARETRDAPEGGEERKTESIDLVSVLELAGTRSLDVEIFRERLKASEAELDRATSLFLPSIRVDVDYRHHEGKIQETDGHILDVSKSSLLLGPGLHFGADPAAAHFERLRAQQTLEATRHGSERTRGEAMVRSAHLYLDLLQARALMEVAREAVAHSSAQVELSESMVEARAELRVDLARARAELARDQERLIFADTTWHQTSVELAVWLRLPPETLLVPDPEQVEPTTLLDPKTDPEELLAIADSSRPDLKEFVALREAARRELQGARWTPWFPEVNVFASYGAFGGGTGSTLGDFGDRGDFAAGLSWTFEGLGLGDVASYRQARARAREAEIQVVGRREMAAGQVLGTLEEARGLLSRIEAARTRVESAAEALELVQVRYVAGDAIQLEILEGNRNLADSRATVVQAITQYNKAQHLLYYLVRGRSWEE